VAPKPGWSSTISEPHDILLFSYGTLQQEAVQLHAFGRTLDGEPDAILGYRIVEQLILDPEVVRLSGSNIHPNLVATGDPADQVAGTLYFISEAELAGADSYEVADYHRIEVPLKSGRTAWLYVKAAEDD
jgi:gamma-glutamylcyclotransferase (GGCT)/AIG2-like uncharacterized protein YtfP